MEYKERFDPNLIDLEVEATSEEEAFKIIVGKLLENGMVNDGYIQGITNREKNFQQD